MSEPSFDSSPVILKAPAKINLVLRVIGRRSDGYHELETWMQKLSLCDTISFRVTDSGCIQLQCSPPGLPEGPENLLWKAAELFLNNSKAAKNKGVTLFLEKRIPISAGLGGGSSDAGTLLKGLNAFFGNEFSESQLIDFGVTLGADVPFFVTEMKSVVATGVGEVLVETNPLKDCMFLLVNPGIAVSTAEIFRKFALTRANKNSTLTGSRKLDPDKLSMADLENDLESTVSQDLSIINRIKKDLLAAGAERVLMSGSGPTVFGVFRQIPSLQRGKINDIAKRISQTYGEQVFITE